MSQILVGRERDACWRVTFDEHDSTVLVAVLALNNLVDFKNENTILLVRALFAVLSAATYYLWSQILTPKVCQQQ